MNLLDAYLINVNTYPRFKKTRVNKLMNKHIWKLVGISLLLLLAKIGGETIAESLLK
jgi:hypothetical protein